MTKGDAEMRAINAIGWEFSEDARRHLAILEAVGLLKFEPHTDDVWSIKPRVISALKGAYVGAAIRQPLEEGDCHFIIGWLENAGLKIVDRGQK